ncbi:MAG: winged helix-turn-helix domain-containing protein [Cyanobacteriota bacterium]
MTDDFQRSYAGMGGQLSESLHRKEPMIRRHLEQLVEADLVAAQRQGRGRSYTLSQKVYQRILELAHRRRTCSAFANTRVSIRARA